MARINFEVYGEPGVIIHSDNGTGDTVVPAKSDMVMLNLPPLPEESVNAQLVNAQLVNVLHRAKYHGKKFHVLGVSHTIGNKERGIGMPNRFLLMDTHVVTVTLFPVVEKAEDAKP